MKFAELKAHWNWMLEHMADDEPVIFPRREAKKRLAVNAPKRHRFSFVCTDEDLKELTAVREAYVLACGDNPTIATHAMLEAMKTFDLLGWLRQQEESDE